MIMSVCQPQFFKPPITNSIEETDAMDFSQLPRNIQEIAVDFLEEISPDDKEPSLKVITLIRNGFTDMYQAIVSENAQ